MFEWLSNILHIHNWEEIKRIKVSRRTSAWNVKNVSECPTDCLDCKNGTHKP